MTKAISAGFEAHLAKEVTTVATGWRIERRDGVVFRFTDNSVDVTADFGLGDGSQTYLASAGFSRTNITASAELDIDNLEVTAILDDAVIKETELRAGLFDFAEVKIFVFNHQDTSQGMLRMSRGNLGEVLTTTQGFFTTEARGIGQVMANRVGELYTVDCKFDLGDARCRLPIEPPVLLRNQDVLVGEFYRVVTAGSPDGTSADYEDRIYVVKTAGTTAGSQPTYDTVVGNDTTDGTAVLTAEESWTRFAIVSAVDGTEPRRRFTVAELTPNSGGPRGGFPDDWMNLGAATFETGDNSGVTMEVRDFAADDDATITQDVELFQDLPSDIVVGDKLRIFPGCDKRMTTCVTKFLNELNFGGEPNIPGTDWQARYPDAR